MWYFSSPRIVYGEDALCHLAELNGRRAFIVTDRNIVRLGFVDRVREYLDAVAIESLVFADVEADPSLQNAKLCAEAMTEFGPDWIIGLGGGSCIDTAKAAWFLYERPDADPAAINPFEHYGLREKAKLMAIPTTSGTGAEVTFGTVLTDTEEQRKLGLGSYELVPDVAIVDPAFVASLPPHITADTGMDALTHAIEGYTSTCHNDFCDGLCLKAAQLVFEYLPRAFYNGSDSVAREHMHNAATIAGLGFGNSMAALAHSMGHALGAIFHTPHGQAVGLFLPYTIQFNANGDGSRYGEIARFLGYPAQDEPSSAANLVAAISGLQQELGQARRIRDLGITHDSFDASVASLIANAESDTALVMNTRIPDSDELERLFRYAYQGQTVDF